MFKKTKNIFNKYINNSKYTLTGETREFSDDELIEFYDSDGKKLYIEKEKFRSDILPYNIKQAWNNPQNLYNLILSNVDDFSQELEETARRQLEIDDIPERSYTIASIVFMRNNKFLDARQFLEKYIEKYGPTAVILTNLAKTYQDATKSKEILWEALQLDPNFENGLKWWLAICAEQGGKEAYQRELITLSQLPHTWRPQLYLAGEYLSNKNLEKAMPLINHVLDTAPLESDTMAVISGYLGTNGFIQEIINIILPRYTRACSEPFGLLQNILQAFYELRMVKEGLEFINALKSSQPTPNSVEKIHQIQLMELLKYYEEMFEKTPNKENFH